MEVRRATPGEIDAICEFGAVHIPGHYEPLLGPEAARAQVDQWWTRDRIARAVAEGRAVVAVEDGTILGVGEWSIYEGSPVIWKLYVHPSARGRGIGPQLLGRIFDDVPEEASRIRVEHFAANTRAGDFYAREGFEVIGTAQHPNPALRVTWRERALDHRPG